MDCLKAKGQQVIWQEKPILLRGVGFGGWLNLEGYLWNLESPYDRGRTIEALLKEILGEEEKEIFLRRYEDAFITENDFRFLSSHGINSVRVPFNCRRLWKDNAFDPHEIRHLDDAVSWGKKYHLFVFLDCHAAPGGQTGANIDDTIDNFPHLFEETRYQDELVSCWQALAERYRDESWVGGYDLLNEPLKPGYASFAPLLLPLYRRLLRAIRSVDPDHMIVLEGSHWATDFSPLSGFSPAEASDNLLFEFHKYWNSPDRESLSNYLAFQKQFDIPLWCGESGENNCEWYSLNFPMLEREGIGWCFWAYKKMGNSNGFSRFLPPTYWKEIVDYSKGGPFPSHGKEALNGLLDSVRTAEFQDDTVNACLRLPSTILPAVSYDDWELYSPRLDGVLFRKTDPVSICFLDGHQGEPNFNCPTGEPFSKKDQMCVLLNAGESLFFSITTLTNVRLCAIPRGEGAFCVSVDSQSPSSQYDFFLLANTKHQLRIQSKQAGSRLFAVELHKKE